MRSRLLPATAILVLLVAACGRAPQPDLTQAAPATATRTPTEPPIATAQPSAAPTLPPTATARPSVTPTLPPTATATPMPMPTASAMPTLTPAPIASDQRFVAHTVAPGETLAALAGPDMTPAQIAAYNHLHSDRLRPGMPLLLPRSAPVTPETLLVERGNPDAPRVAITLDAGASAAPTPQILDTLRAHGVRVTFFLTGRWMRDNPELTRRIVAEGHELANHSLNHPDFRTLDRAAMLEELNATERIAQEIAGASTRPFFRPPYGAYNREVLATVIEAGYLPIYWTLDSLDSVGQPKSAEFLVERITTRLAGEQANGAIVLMHCGSQPTADALPRLLEHFAARGVKVTTVSEVLGP
ncbi:polysaccharide deacetylase family protein [Kallotenue papyrolyticum]|uniref:polysaccharide deacetylase family protein n=1 Tax=Kallotenue papyrolyticum TaxID=1325125 RepID=UPI0004929A0D|nr:polysaccharide deacetylase family protein [Kallotenue papyrolyticum]